MPSLPELKAFLMGSFRNCKPMDLSRSHLSSRMMVAEIDASLAPNRHQLLRNLHIHSRHPLRSDRAGPWRRVLELPGV